MTEGQDPYLSVDAFTLATFLQVFRILLTPTPPELYYGMILGCVIKKCGFKKCKLRLIPIWSMKKVTGGFSIVSWPLFSLNFFL